MKTICRNDKEDNEKIQIIYDYKKSMKFNSKLVPVKSRAIQTKPKPRWNSPSAFYYSAWAW